MEKINKTIYVAYDGQEFSNVEDCVAHEKRCGPRGLLLELGAKEIKNHLHLDCLMDASFGRADYFLININYSNIDKFKALLRGLTDNGWMTCFSGSPDNKTQYVTESEMVSGLTYVLTFVEDCEYLLTTSYTKLLTCVLAAMEEIATAEKEGIDERVGTE